MTAVLLLPAANGQFGTDIAATFYNNITTDLRNGLTMADKTFIPKADGETVAQSFLQLQSLVDELTSVESLDKTLNEKVGRMQRPVSRRAGTAFLAASNNQYGDNYNDDDNYDNAHLRKLRKRWTRDYGRYHGVPYHDQVPPSHFYYLLPRRRRDPGNGSASIFHGALPSLSGGGRDA